MISLIARTVFLTLALLALPGCNKPSNSNADLETVNLRTGVKPIADAEVAVIETEKYGDIVVELYPNVAPQMVERFKKLIHEGFYDGTAIHRINEQSALIQGGDPLSRDDNPANDGSGDSPYPNVPAEFSDLPFERGSLGAARREAAEGRPGLSEAEARDSANCQFFITMEREPDYDESYTLFGKVIAGLGNVEIIMRAPVEPETETPADKITIKRITLQDRARYPPSSK